MIWLKRSVGMLVLIVALCTTLLWVLLKSQWGGRWLIASLKDWTDGVVIAQGFNGRLIGEFSIDSVVIDTGYERIDIRAISIQTRALLPIMLVIERADIDSVAVSTSQRPPSADDSNSLVLPSIVIPLDIVISSLDIARLNVLMIEQPIVSGAAISAEFSLLGSVVEIKTLGFSQGDSRIDARGQLALTGDYPIDITVITEVSSTTPKTAAQLDITQSVAAPYIDIASTGWLSGQAHIDLSAWRISGRIPMAMEFSTGPLSQQNLVETPAAFHGISIEEIVADGYYQNGLNTTVRAAILWDEYDLAAAIDSQFSLDADRLDLKHLELTQLTPTPAALSPQLSLSGTVNFENERLDLNAHWEQLGWPLAEPDYSSNTGQLSFMGTTDDFRLQASADVGRLALGHGFVDIDLNAVDRLVAINAFQLQGNYGRVQLTGNADLGKEQQLDVSLSLAELNAGFFDDRLESAISAEADLVASFGDELSAQSSISELGGDFQGHALTGGGDLAWKNGCFRANNFAIRSGDDVIALNGAACPEDELSLSIAINSLDDWHIPQLSGAIVGDAIVKFGASLRDVILQLSAKSGQLSYGEEMALRDAAIDLQLGFGDTSNDSELNFRAAEVQVGTVDVESLAIAISGTQEDHQFSVRHGSVGPELQGIDVAGRGRLSEDEWDGEIDRFDIQAKRLWQLSDRFELHFSKQRQMVDPFCLLANGEAKLCASLKRIDDELRSVMLDIVNVPIAWASPVMPFLSNADNYISSRLVYESSDTNPKAEATFTLSGDQLTLVSRSGLLLELPLSETSAQGVFVDDIFELSGGARLAESGSIRLSGRISDLSGVPQIDTQMQLEISDFGWFDGAAFRVEHLAGDVRADIRAFGPLISPEITGELALLNANFELSKYGTLVTGLNTHVHLRPGWQVDLSGGANIDGEVSWSGQFDGLRGDMAIDVVGSNLRLAESPSLSVLASPSVRMVANGGNLSITGAVDVHEGNFHIDEAPDVVGTSSDVIYIDEQMDIPTSSLLPKNYELDFDVAIQPGFRVTSKAFYSLVGGNLELKKSFETGLRAFGTINISEGEYLIYSSRMPIKSGRISFSGGAIDNPNVDIQVEKKVDDVIVGVDIKGSSSDPTVQLYSQPYMSDTERLSYLVFEAPPSDDTAAQLAFMQATEYLRAGQQINELLGAATFTISPTKASIGRHLNRSFWVGFNYYLHSSSQQSTNTADDNTEFVLRYRVNSNISVEASMGETRGIDGYYTLETDDP